MGDIDHFGRQARCRIESADIYLQLTDDIRQKKYRIITELYGFTKDSFEARTSPEAEAFWHIKKS